LLSASRPPRAIFCSCGRAALLCFDDAERDYYVPVAFASTGWAFNEYMDKELTVLAKLLGKANWGWTCGRTGHVQAFSNIDYEY